MNSNLLMIFIKNPVEGEVKTRLGSSIGSTNALQIYKKLLTHTREVALKVETNRQVWYSSMIDHRDSWNKERFDKKLQSGSDLGERMSVAFQKAFEDGYEKVVIIGSDCADITSRHIKDAFHALNTKDAVIGPSKDGGYYLLGIRKYTPDIFSGISWSTQEVFEQTVSRFEHLGLSYSVLDVLNDIDTIEDLRDSNLSLP